MIGHAAAVREWHPIQGSDSEIIVYVIQSVIIRPDFRSRGLGKDLMNQVEQALIAYHPNVPSIRLVLEAAADSRQLQFYIRLGYTVTQNSDQKCCLSPTSSSSNLSGGFRPLESSSRPPPPPPPLPPALLVPASNSSNLKVTLHKILTCLCDKS